MIKFAIMADIHLTEKQPKYRCDNTKQALLGKFKWVIDEAIYNGCEALCIAGDLFDSSRCSYEFTSEIARLLVNYIEDIRIIAVAGNHDLRYYIKGLTNTPLGVLASSGLIEIAHHSYPIEFDDFNIYGISCGEEDQLKTLSASASNADILLIHTMITGGKPLWPGQKHWTGAKAFLRGVPFKYVFSGDNHQRIIAKIGDRVLINSGSLLRKTKAQVDFHPILTLLTYEDGTLEEYPIPLSPSEKVFDLDKIHVAESKVEVKESMSKLMDTIRAKNTTINPQDILQEIIGEKQPNELTVEIINDVMESVLKGE